MKRHQDGTPEAHERLELRRTTRRELRGPITLPAVIGTGHITVPDMVESAPDLVAPHVTDVMMGGRSHLLPL